MTSKVDREVLVQYVVAVLVGLVLAEVATLITTIYLHRVLSHAGAGIDPQGAKVGTTEAQ